MIKGAYKDYEELSAASSEPIIAEPHIVGGISIDSSYRQNISVVLKMSKLKKYLIYRFLMIASPGLLKTLEEATGTNQVNKELALLVVEQVNT